MRGDERKVRNGGFCVDGEGLVTEFFFPSLFFFLLFCGRECLCRQHLRCVLSEMLIENVLGGSGNGPCLFLFVTLLLLYKWSLKLSSPLCGNVYC